MSILIRGMKLPQSCDSCRMCYTDVYGVPICAVCDEPANTVLCPLVEIPTPHGRLKEENYLTGLMDDGDHYPTGLLDAADVYNAPTIIEAEGGGEDD